MRSKHLVVSVLFLTFLLWSTFAFCEFYKYNLSDLARRAGILTGIDSGGAASGMRPRGGEASRRAADSRSGGGPRGDDGSHGSARSRR